MALLFRTNSLPFVEGKQIKLYEQRIHVCSQIKYNTFEQIHSKTLK